VAGGAEIGNIAGRVRPSGEHNIPQHLVSAEKALRELLSGASPIDAVRAAIDILAQHTSNEDLGASKATLRTGHESSLERLVAQASLYSNLTSFLNDLALGSPQDGYEAHGECVSLMTMHAAKGLEFDYVFVAGLEEGIIPFMLFEGQDTVSGRKESGENSSNGVATIGDQKSLKNKQTSEHTEEAPGHHDNTRIQERIEEERRLLYVAMTRARVGLYLSWARSRRFLGRRLSFAPSRFLAQIEDLVPLVERSAPKKPKDSQPELF
jgi:superfamily I DNA/RNA helicase